MQVIRVIYLNSTITETELSIWNSGGGVNCPENNGDGEVKP